MRHTTRVTGPESLGHLIQQARIASGQTQADLAGELGISQRTITEIETGKSTKQMRRVFQLLKTVGVTLHGEWEATDG
jgi:HTH-type transcriptional regulator/antitoxin HipB